MYKIITSLLIALFVFAGIAEAKVYRYKYQFVLVINTDGQTPTTAWEWSEWRGGWSKRPIANSSMDLQDATGFSCQYDSATNTSATTDFDINYLPSVDNTTYDNDPYYSTDNIGDAKIKTIAITVPSGFMKVTIDEDSAATGIIDLYCEVTKPY